MPRVACKFYAEGRCNRGDECTFYHDPAVQPQAAVCRFYQSGHCRAGNSCRFRHEDAPNSGSDLAEANGVLHSGDIQFSPPADGILDSDDLEYISREYLPELDEYAREVRFPSFSPLADGADMPAFSDDECPPVLDFSVPNFPGGWEQQAENEHEEIVQHLTEEMLRLPDSLDLTGTDSSDETESEEEVSILSGSSEQYPDRGAQAMLDYIRFGNLGMPEMTVEEVTDNDANSEDSKREDDGHYRHARWEALAKERGEDNFEAKSLCQTWREKGYCPTWRSCSQVHGHRCETCGKWTLHPYNRDEAKQHQEICTERAERENARQTSGEQECNICFEAISDKPAQEQKFGLLACDHCFCLGCVRDWRAQKDPELNLEPAIRACPVCRKRSDFVTPSKVWPSTKEEKTAIIDGYKARLATINCRYWMRSSESDRRCPFGTSCFYFHPGEKKKILRVVQTADGDMKFNTPLQFGDFFSARGL